MFCVPACALYMSSASLAVLSLHSPRFLEAAKSPRFAPWAAKTTKSFHGLAVTPDNVTSYKRRLRILLTGGKHAGGN
jgi:hypothetical protein